MFSIRTRIPLPNATQPCGALSSFADLCGAARPTARYAPNSHKAISRELAVVTKGRDVVMSPQSGRADRRGLARFPSPRAAAMFESLPRFDLLRIRSSRVIHAGDPAGRDAPGDFAGMIRSATTCRQSARSRSVNLVEYPVRRPSPGPGAGPAGSSHQDVDPDLIALQGVAGPAGSSKPNGRRRRYSGPRSAPLSDDAIAHGPRSEGTSGLSFRRGSSWSNHQILICNS